MEKVRRSFQRQKRKDKTYRHLEYTHIDFCFFFTNQRVEGENETTFTCLAFSYIIDSRDDIAGYLDE